MAVLVITLNDHTFDKKTAEVGFLAYALGVAALEIQRGQGATTTGTILGIKPETGGGNASLGAWTYTPSATNP